MAKAFDTFGQYAFGHYAGQLEDRNMCDVITRLAHGSDIGYGLAVCDLDVNRAALVDSEYTDPTGITVRETVRDNEADGSVAVYPEDHEMSVIRVGRVWVKCVDGCSAEDAVYVDPDDGSIVSTASGNTAFPNAVFKTAAVAGGMALVQLDGNG